MMFYVASCHPRSLQYCPTSDPSFPDLKYFCKKLFDTDLGWYKCVTSRGRWSLEIELVTQTHLIAAQLMVTIHTS